MGRYGPFKLIPQCFGFHFATGSIPPTWDLRPAALKRWRVKAYHAWCASYHTVASVDLATRTIMFANAAENPFGAQIGSSGRRWLIEGADEIPLRAGSGQWRLAADSSTLQYAPPASALEEDYEPAAPAGKACRAAATMTSSCCSSSA